MIIKNTELWRVHKNKTQVDDFISLQQIAHPEKPFNDGIIIY